MSDELDNCGCCDASGPDASVENPPGLTALVYRIGTHNSFLERMLSELSRATVQDPGGKLRYPLAGLSTRLPDDPSIGILDAWATLGDVLTFYQERIANEGFLRTATERRSILELARLIGYELNPGVAASAYLRFEVDTAQGAPSSAVLPKGMKVQSVPGQNELPQTFETSGEITARAEWNELKPRMLRPQELAVDNANKLFLLGLSAGFGSGAQDLDIANVEPLNSAAPLPSSGSVQAVEVASIYLDGTGHNIKPGDVMLFVGRKPSSTNARTLAKVVRGFEDENSLNRTRIDFESDTPVASPTYLPVHYTLASATIQQQALNAQSVDSTIINQAWSNNSLNAFLSVQGWNVNSVLAYAYGAYARALPQPKLSPADPGAFAMRARAGFFGGNAPPWNIVTKDLATKPVDWDTNPVSIWKDSQSTPAYYTDADCFLDRAVQGVTANSWAVLELNKALTPFRVKLSIESSVSGFGFSARSTGLHLANNATGDELDQASEKSESFKVRKTTAHVASERITLAQLPIEENIGQGTSEETQLTLDRMVLNLAVGQLVSVTGERADLPGAVVSEVVTLSSVLHSGGFTTLFFESPGLVVTYVRKTVTLSANIALATHGETVTEVLGSGLSALANQTFGLKRPPLTFTASSDETGAASSLEVRVDGVLWERATSLVELEPASERYMIRISDEGKPSVIFGDGRRGARIPAGIENVAATYRSGIGTPGVVGAGKLTLLMTRPLGIRGVSNPLPSSGAADPESRDSARENAPRTVLAMGRIVTLQDAEDFARAFAGIGKAKAMPLWHGGVQWVHLTVAAAAAVPSLDGATTLPDYRVDLNSPLGQNLAAAVESSKESSMRIQLDTYQPGYFDVKARVLINARYLWAAVSASIEAALLRAFAFEARSFAQAITVAEVQSRIQAVPGVVFVDLDELHRFDQPTPPLPAGSVLFADSVAWDEDEADPGSLSQLLLINPLGITLIEIPQEASL